MRRDNERGRVTAGPDAVTQAAELSAQARPGLDAQEDDVRQSYYVGKCGHRVFAEPGVSGLLFLVGPCHECNEEPPVE